MAASRGAVGVSILIGPDTRLVVQGITGREGEFHSRAMQAYGTAIVAGVTPGKGGQTALDGSVAGLRHGGRGGPRDRRRTRPASSSRRRARRTRSWRPPAAGIATIFCITEGIPALDMIAAVEAVARAGARLIGPNCPGATSPGSAKVGIIPGSVHREGRVGVVSRSGTLTYEAVQAMTDAGVGQSTCIGIGGDPIIGTTFLDVLQLFADDPDTDAIVLIGEIGGAAEEDGRRVGRRAPRGHPEGRLHRRPDRARGQADGPRRGDHLGRRRDRGVQGRGARGGRVPGRGLPDRAAGAPARRRLPRLTRR